MKTPYETMFLLPPTTSVEQVDTFVAHLQEVIEKKSGEVTKIDKMGVRKTAYAVNKLNSAFYVLLQYKGDGAAIHEVERTLKNSDEVFKYLSTKITTKPPIAPRISKKKAEKAAAAAAAAAAAVVKETPAAASPAEAPAAPGAKNGTQE